MTDNNKYANREGEDESHKSKKESSKRKGNTYFSSIGSLHGNATSRKDDIISLMYLLFDLYFGTLPWEDITKGKVW